jgi:hypothetical protein
MDMLEERADEDGNIVVVDEGDIHDDWGEMLKLRIEQINRIRRLKGLPELTMEEYFANCRPNQITDESIVCLVRE